jgi:type II secretory pathway pseudopilin PulG
MSFFDDDDSDTRTRSQPRPRRAARAGGPSTDPQAVLVRRGVAIAAAILLLLLMGFVIRSCRSSAQENALKDYNREVASIARASETQVGRPFFQRFGGQTDAGSPTDLQSSVAALRQEAENQLDQAEEIDVPGEMAPAHRSLLIALELRRDGLDFIAQRVRAALGSEGDQADEATTAIAGQMQAFLASDVLYRTRVQTLIKQALDKAEIGGQDIAPSRFLPNIEWLSPRVVGRAPRRQGGGGGGRRGERRRARARPPRHGA